MLIILAGVTIATLTGDNRITTERGQDAKIKSTDGEIEEEIKLAWNKVYADNYLDNTIDKAKALAVELGIEETAVTTNGNKISVTYREKNKVLDMSTGTVKEISAVAKAKMLEKIEDNTPITDDYGNTFIVPKEFKVAADSAEVVTEGIVIEDATYLNSY